MCVKRVWWAIIGDMACFNWNMVGFDWKYGVLAVQWALIGIWCAWLGVLKMMCFNFK